MKSSTGESYDVIRKLSVEERKRRFIAFMQARNELQEESTVGAIWHPVDDPMTPEQRENIPPARPGENRTPIVWVKFRHPRMKEIVISRAYFDYETGDWTARLKPIREGGLCGQVTPMAWMPMTEGAEPTGWLVIPRE